MKNFRSFILVLLALFGMLYSVRSTDAQAGTGYVRVTFAFRSRSVTLHEPVYIDFLIYNGLPHAIQFDLGANSRTNFKFSIQGPAEGRREVGPLREPSFSARGQTELLPGKAYKSVLLLNRWYQFTVPGTYHVLPHLATPITAATGAVASITNPPELEIEVLPRNPNGLRDVCAGLAAIATSSSGGKSLDAAEALSYVLDLDAVPYLIRVARTGDNSIRSIAVDGLARILHVEGLEPVFREAAGPVNAQLRSAVKQAAYNMEHGVSAAD